MTIQAERRYTDENFTRLAHGEVFVFGSNEAGIHGKGAALQAVKFGAVMGKGRNLYGRTFAIPTKDRNLETLPLHIIAENIDVFRMCVLIPNRKDPITWLVTKIGCGLAGYTPEQIAPMLSWAYNRPEVILPKEFVEVIENYGLTNERHPFL